ncbi:uncharacterized protein LOC117178151 [Belonocnema kinseyi]|uniref:uncharacterized protein LOC117178151 n=1 Tax=Belonocnema kinseyi TaxID=2817044 RepID=UPI00143D56ED|nr:uncharacterized protein LOC117178151 [Belonocnema kinseyi]
MAEFVIKAKRSRAPNFTKSEIEVFTSLLPVYKNIIESKRTDTQTRNEKAGGWNALCDEFNTQSTVYFRSVENLKSLWDNLKKGARRAARHSRAERNKPGEGEINRNGDPSLTDQKVISIMGPSVVGLFNQFDGDANVPSEVHSDVELSEIEFSAVPEPEPSVVFTYKEEALETSDPLSPSPKIIFPPASPIKSSTGVQNTSKEKWGEYLPKILYNRKSDDLRVNLCVGGSAKEKPERPSFSATSTSASSGSEKDVRNRTISEEDETVQHCKRRRPVLRENVEAKELVKAKVELVRCYKQRLEDESKRRQELHEVDMRKKMKEVELLDLQVLKLKKELGLK